MTYLFFHLSIPNPIIAKINERIIPPPEIIPPRIRRVKPESGVGIIQMVVIKDANKSKVIKIIPQYNPKEYFFFSKNPFFLNIFIKK